MVQEIDSLEEEEQRTKAPDDTINFDLDSNGHHPDTATKTGGSGLSYLKGGKHVPHKSMYALNVGGNVSKKNSNQNSKLLNGVDIQSCN